jgi:hypothetical protein
MREPGRRNGWRVSGVIGLSGPVVLWAGLASAAQVTINAIQDNTIADGVDPGTGEHFEDNISGACEDVFSGTTNDAFARRALLQFGKSLVPLTVQTA